jgi:hypothetical protein
MKITITVLKQNVLITYMLNTEKLVVTHQYLNISVRGFGCNHICILNYGRHIGTQLIMRLPWTWSQSRYDDHKNNHCHSQEIKPGHPVQRQSLYSLSYPGLHGTSRICIITKNYSLQGYDHIVYKLNKSGKAYTS